MMNAEQYSTYLQEAGASQGPSPSEIIDPAGVNWFKEVSKTAPMESQSNRILKKI